MHHSRARNATAALTAIALVLVGGLSAALIPAQPAAAGLFNVMPTDVDGFPNYEFTTADVLGVYVTSDIKGGRVCIVPASVTEPSAGSCSGQPWGKGPNHIVAIGSYFGLLEGPSLEEGNWRLLTETATPADPPGPGVDLSNVAPSYDYESVALSEVFTVSPCPGCSTALAEAQMAEWKLGALNMFQGSAASCTAITALSKYDDAKNLSTSDIPGAPGGVSIVFTVGGGFVLGFPSDINPTATKAKEILKNLTCLVSKMYEDIVNDPPDPDYGTIVDESIRSVPAANFPGSTSHGLAESLATVEGFGRASLDAFEKYLGADAAGSVQGQIDQLRSTSEHTKSLVRAMRDTADWLDVWAPYADTDPSLAGAPVATVEEGVAWQQAAQALAGGWPAEKLQQFLALGLTADQIEAARLDLVRASTAAPTPTTLGDQARALSTLYRENADRFDAFGREASAIAATIEVNDESNAPLTAVISADVTNGTAPLTVHFDGSASTPQNAITSYEWNFGNGAGSSAPAPGMVYSAPGTYQVSLRVRADDGREGWAQQTIIVEAPENRPPIARDDSAVTTTGGTVSIEVGANDGDPDGSLTSIEIVEEPGFGQASCSSTQYCTYSAPATGTGTDRFRYRITDTAGATAEAAVRISIVAPEAVAAVDDSYTIASGATWVLLPLANDFSPAQNLVIQSVTTPAHGSLSCDIGGTECRYTASSTVTLDDTFTYTARDGGGETDTATVTIHIDSSNQPPAILLAQEDFSVVEGTQLYTANFLSATDPDGLIEKYSWVLDGAEVGADPQYIPAFRDQGEYDVTLVVTDDVGATASRTLHVSVSNGPPTVYGTEFFSRARPGDPKLFQATAMDPGPDDAPLAHWDFGDGGTAVGSPVTHTFEAPGTYAVRLWAVDKDGAESDPFVSDVTVVATVLDAGPDISIDQGESALFDLTGSTPQDSRLRYELDPGDGRAAFAADLPNMQWSQVYTVPGVYTATVTQTDQLDPENPLVATDTVQVEVRNLAPTIRGLAHNAPIAGEPVSFVVYADDPAGAENLDYEWDFGGGYAPGTRVAEHVFATPGEARVLVRVLDQHGGSFERVLDLAVATDAAASELTSVGREFWLAFDANYTPAGFLAFFVSGAEGTGGVVEVPGLGFATDFTVPAAGIVRVDVPIEARLGMGSDASSPRVEALAVHVSADDDISLYGLNRIQFSTDAFMALPVPALGDRYRVLDYGSEVTPGLFSVVATSGTTTVTVTPSNGDEPFERTLLMGEALEYEAQRSSLTGTLIESDRPVAVFGGARCAFVPTGSSGYCDHLTEMLTPTSAWGRSFATVPLATRAADTFRVLADTAGTVVTLTGGKEDVVTLEPGEFHEFAASAPVVIDSTQPVLVAQYSQGSTADNTLSDPFIALVAPLEQGLTDSVFATPIDGFTNYVNITAPTASRGDVQLDGTTIPDAQWSAIGETGYSAAALALEPGTHRIASPVAVSTLVYGFGSDDSYGFPGGMRVARIADVQSLALSPTQVSGLPDAMLCTTATLLGESDPIAGARLDVVVTGVVEDVFTVVTDAAGEAEVCATSSAQGAASVTVSIGARSREATFSWIARGEHLPEATIVVPPVAVEGTIVPLTVSATDADGDALTYAWDLDADGQYDNGTDAAASLAAPLTGSYPVSVRVSDGTGTVTASATVVVANAVPQVDLPGTAAVGRGGHLSLPGSFADPGADTWTATVDWGQGAVPLALTGKTFTLAHEFPAPGTYPVTVTVRDAAGGSAGSAVVSVSVAGNRAPALESIANRTLTEGDSIRLPGRAIDPDGDPVTLSWQAGAAPLMASPLPEACTATPDGDDLVVTCDDDATVTVRLTATDAPTEPQGAAGLSATREAVLTFGNAAPTVAEAIIEAAPGGGGGFSRAVVPLSTLFAAALPPGPSQASATFIDPGDDEFTCGASVGAVEFEGLVDDGSCVIALPELAAGAQTLQTWVADDDGGVGTSSTSFAVAGDDDPTTPGEPAPPPPAPAGGASLPATGGTDLSGVSLLGFALLVGGLALALRRRARRSPTSGR
ncbi:PKD domain-containing protein [Microbacterium sp. SS28]|uniref:PKD domain-containing protein n=1 Tax=Microbacterium sp. SS28 TaxID=2919948 RepID=UPI001FA970E1|nr:PKD domain-containing protein [Microbacterium sp. SS28]